MALAEGASVKGRMNPRNFDGRSPVRQFVRRSRRCVLARVL